METVRDGKKVWPYCSECGCRLAIVYNGENDWYTVEHYGWQVYSISENLVDARGHECSLVGKGWITSPESLSHLISV